MITSDEVLGTHQNLNLSANADWMFDIWQVI